MKKSFIILLLLLCAIAHTWGINVTFDIQPRLLRMGESATGTITFHDVQNAPQIQFPDIPGLSISGPRISSNMSVINGARSSSVALSYQIFPTRAGAYTIGPYNLEFNGETFSLPAISLDVRAADDKNAGASTNEMFFVNLEIASTNLFIHQVFDIILKIYTAPEVNIDSRIQIIGGLPESGFHVANYEEIQSSREVVNGSIYNVRQFRGQAQALTSGTFVLQPQMRLNVLTPRKDRNRDPFFGSFFDSGYQSTPVDLTTPPHPVTIRPIPTAGRPTGYTGAVGQFGFDVVVKPTVLTAGEPITVTTTLQGAGNIALLQPPTYRDTDLFKTYDARQSDQRTSADQREGLKVFDQVVIPRSENLKELPALEFSYFDPIAARYRTISKGPFPLTVHPAANGGQSMMLQTAIEPIGHKTLVLGADIIYLKPAPARWKSPPPSPGIPFILRGASYIGAILILVILQVIVRRKRRLAGNIALARRRKAPHHARASLKKAEKEIAKPQPDISAYFGYLHDAVCTYFAHRFNLSAGEADGTYILNRLKHTQVSEETIRQWTQFFQMADQVRFSSPPDFETPQLNGWLEMVTELLRQIEKVKL